MPQIQDYAAVASAAIAVGAVVYAAHQARVQHRREDFELARALHADLTTGPVAEARDLLGTVSFTGAAPSGRHVDDVRRAYFTLLWCFERIEGGRGSMAERRPAKTDLAAVRYLDKIIGWHVRFWDGEDGFRKIRSWLNRESGGTLDDTSSYAAFERLSRYFPPAVPPPGVASQAVPASART